MRWKKKSMTWSIFHFQQLKCVDIISGRTYLLSNEAIALFGAKPYPGVSQEQCFKVVGFIDVSSFKFVNSEFGQYEGDETINDYAEEMKKRLQGALSDLSKENEQTGKVEISLWLLLHTWQ